MLTSREIKEKNINEIFQIIRKEKEILKSLIMDQEIKIELLGIAIILLGIAVTTNNFWGYVLGVLGFGCFLKDNH